MAKSCWDWLVVGSLNLVWFSGPWDLAYCILCTALQCGGNMIGKDKDTGHFFGFMCLKKWNEKSDRKFK